MLIRQDLNLNVNWNKINRSRNEIKNELNESQWKICFSLFCKWRKIKKNNSTKNIDKINEYFPYN